jgi:hypothetical protein
MQYVSLIQVYMDLNINSATVGMKLIEWAWNNFPSVDNRVYTGAS